MFSPYKYVIPANRISETSYLSVLPVKYILKLIPTEVEEIPTFIRAQRTLGKVRDPEFNFDNDSRGSLLFQLLVFIDADLHFDRAVLSQPKLKENFLAVRFVQDTGLTQFKGSFEFINLRSFPLESQYPVSKKKLIMAEAVIREVEVFKYLTDAEHTTLPVRSKKLFTLSSIQNATLRLC